MDKLSPVQKLFLALMGVVILVVQLFDVADNGIRGVSWVLSMVAGAVLILPSLSLLPSRLSFIKLKDQLALVTGAFPLPNERAEMLLQLVITKATELQKALPNMIEGMGDIKGVGDIQSLAGAYKLMQSVWHGACLDYVACLAIMGEYKKNPKYFAGAEYKALVTKVVQYKVQVSERFFRSHGLDVDLEVIIRSALTAWAEARKATDTFIERLALSIPDPDSPLNQNLIEKLSVPENLREGFVEKLRPFTKRAMADFMSAI